MVVLVGYLLEIGILCVWYKFVLRNELEANNIIRRSMQNVMLCGKSWLCFLCEKELIDEEHNKALDKIKKCLLTLFMEMSCLIFLLC